VDDMSREELLELGERVLKLAESKGIRDLAVLIRSSKSWMVRFANNQATIIKHWDEVRVSVRIGYKKRIVIGSVTSADVNEIDRALDKFLAIAKVSKENPLYTPLPEGPFKYEPVERSYDKRVLELVNKVDDVIKTAIDEALTSGAKRCAGQLSFGERTKVLVTTGGVKASEIATSITLTVRGFSDGDASGTGVSCSRTLDDFNPEEAGTRAGRIAKEASKVDNLEAGKYDLILDPLVVSNLFGYVLGATSALGVYMKFSYFTDLLGKEVSTSALTIADSPREPRVLGSTSFDDEGIPTRNTVVIERGVLKSLLHNSMTARLFNVKSTGNAGWISPSPRVLKVSPGNYKEEELFEEVKRGIYVSNNWYTRYQNYREGTFSSVCRDGVFYVESGELKFAVRGLRISDNFLSLLKNVKALSNKLYHVYWWESALPSIIPYVLVSNVNITKALF